MGDGSQQALFVGVRLAGAEAGRRFGRFDLLLRTIGNPGDAGTRPLREAGKERGTPNLMQ